MRDLEVGAFLRLRNSIQQALGAVSEQARGGSGAALPEAYLRFREAAFRVIPSEHTEELRGICPEMDEQMVGQAAMGLESNLQSRLYIEAKVLLATLAGFLDGYVEETTLRIEAEERARLAAEAGGQYL